MKNIRAKLLRWLMVSTSLGSIGAASAFTIANVLGSEIRGKDDWTAGLPGMMVLIGTALASVPVSNYMTKKGRGPGLIVGYAAGAAGALLGIKSRIDSQFLVLLPAMFLIGMALTSNQLSRFAAADIAEPNTRSRNIGMVAWCSVIGGVAAPNLINILGNVAQRFSYPGLVGPLGISFLGCCAAIVVIQFGLKPDPLEISKESAPLTVQPPSIPRKELLRQPTVQVAIVVLVFSQLVMVMVMSMTALHMRNHNHDWKIVGLVISAHIAGMYLFSPVVGWVADRFGKIKVIVAGAVIILASNLMAAFQPPESSHLYYALFLLGVGWSCGYVAGSALLTDGADPSNAPVIQGFADFLSSGVAAVSSLIAGLIYFQLGYRALALIGMVLILVPVGNIALHHKELKQKTPIVA